MPIQKIIARRRRASTYIPPRFHRRGTLAAPYQSPTTQMRKTNPKNNAGRRPATPIFNPGLSAGVHTHNPNTRNEPNFPPVSNFKSQISPDLSGSIMRNEPNSHKPTANRQKPTTKNAKRTQFTLCVAFPTFYSRLSPLSRATARATQFTTPY